MRFGYRQLSIYVVATIEALRNTQLPSGIVIEGLVEGLMQSGTVRGQDPLTNIPVAAPSPQPQAVRDRAGSSPTG